MDEIQIAVDLGRTALRLTLVLSLPLLAVGLVVGLFISVMQAATSIQEQTLTFVPKIVAVVVVLALLLPWMVQTLVEYTRDLYSRMPYLFG